MTSGKLPVLEDLPELAGKSVLLRADFNVPLTTLSDGSRIVADGFRIRATLPTINWLTEQGARVTACTHLGRPEGHPDPRYDVEPIRARLAALAPGVELMENLRFDPGEEANSEEFTRRLVAGHDYYVNDAFGASHRTHASIVGPPRYLPSAAGRLLAREAEVIGCLLGEPARPFVAVVGGAKVADKLGMLRALAAKVDTLVVGGGMSYTFLAALGHEVGESLLDPSKIEDCRALLAGSTEVVLPTDIIALGPDNAEVRNVGIDVPDGFEGLDIGPATIARFSEVIASAKTLLWNGPMGMFEDTRFRNGTRSVAFAVAACPGFTVVGGGDSAAAVDEFGLSDKIDHVSTGGGATLELIEYGDLPGLAALRKGRG